VVDFAGSLAQAGKSAACTPGCYCPVSPTSGAWSTRDLRLSQVPREPQCAYAVLSDSGRALVPSLHGTSVLPPLLGNVEGLSDPCDFGALLHGLSTGCLRFVPPLLTTTQNSLPGGGQPFPGGIPVYPLSSVGKFPPCGFPFPWASLGANRSPSVVSPLSLPTHTVGSNLNLRCVSGGIGEG